MYLVCDGSQRASTLPIGRHGMRQCWGREETAVGRLGVFLNKLTVLGADNPVCLTIISDSSVSVQVPADANHVTRHEEDGGKGGRDATEHEKKDADSNHVTTRRDFVAFARFKGKLTV
jgi:hypothetical protein